MQDTWYLYCSVMSDYLFPKNNIVLPTNGRAPQLCWGKTIYSLGNFALYDRNIIFFYFFFGGGGVVVVICIFFIFFYFGGGRTSLGEGGVGKIKCPRRGPIFFCLFFFAGGGGVVAEKIWGGVEGKAKGRKKPRRQITCDDVVRKA